MPASTAKKLKVALGIVTRKVLTGPVEVSVDLTRRCTTDCIMCWYWSPLLKVKPSPEWAHQHIDFEVYKRLLPDFKKLKVKRVVLGGQGDPFLYPQIMDVIELTKRQGMEVCLITSGNYFTETRIQRLYELNVDHIDVSVQAATPETFQKMHPTLKEGTFDKIRESLIRLSMLKKTGGQKLPTVTLIDAICNLNYQDTVQMIDLAAETGAQRVSYKRVDVIPETRELLLNKSQLEELKVLLQDAKQKAAALNISTSVDFYDKYITPGLTTGEYSARYYSIIPCYVGWLSSRILSDGSVIPCCGCYNTSLGNINQSSLYAIWHSPKYRAFRRQSINIMNNPALVKDCKCHSCIDLEFNANIYRKLHPFQKKI